MNKPIIYALLALCAVAPVVALVSTIKASHKASVEGIEANPKLVELELSVSNLSREANNTLQSSSNLIHVLVETLINKVEIDTNALIYASDLFQRNTNAVFVYDPITLHIGQSEVIIESEYEPTATRTTNGWEIRFKE